MTAIYLGTADSVSADSAPANTKAVRQRNDQYPTFNLTALPAAPSSSRTVIRLSALVLFLLGTLLIMA